MVSQGPPFGALIVEERLRGLFDELETMPEERLRRAAAVAQPVGQTIGRSALTMLAFDDSPYDYSAMLKRAAPSG